MSKRGFKKTNLAKAIDIFTFNSYLFWCLNVIILFIHLLSMLIYVHRVCQVDYVHLEADL